MQIKKATYDITS